MSQILKAFEDVLREHAMKEILFDFDVEVKIKVWWRKPPQNDVDAMARDVSQTGVDFYARRLANEIREYLNNTVTRFAEEVNDEPKY